MKLIRPHTFISTSETATILDEDEQDQFMSEMNWPFKLTVFGEEYTLISRGFFGHSHYWGKVLRHANGLLGVWRHDNQLNGGRAYMVDAVPGSISGPQEQTSWLIYSRSWTPEESAFVDKSIAQISKDNPRLPTRIPFTRMKTILKMSYDGDLSVTPSEVPESDNGIPIPSISITPANEAGAIQDEVAMAKPASDAQVPVQSLKIRIRRPANMAAEVACTPSPNPEVEISPSAKVKRSRPSQTKTELAPAPASTLDIAPAKRFRPNKVVLVSDHSQSPSDSRSLPKSGCSGGSKESELSSSHSQSPAVPATRGRPKKVPEPDTSLNFKKKPLADGNGERIQARAEAYWQENRWKSSQVGEKGHAEPATFLAVPLPAVTTATANK
ncbi:hypothetical protein PTTG_08401, partial [Puccinia triticina 1-1 BBBD Race 1]